MDPVEALKRLGGVATYSSLRQFTSRAHVETALSAELIFRDARGRYALAEVDAARRAAHAASGVVSHASAALAWGWKVKWVPERPHVALPRNRNLFGTPRFQPHWLALDPDEVIDGVTSRQRTMTDCLRTLPFDEGLSVADSCLREGGLTQAQLQQCSSSMRGPGAARARTVVAAADGRAANPFESVLRAIALTVPSLQIEPQVELRFDGLVMQPDLVDRRSRLVLEADSQEWHNSDRAQLRRDCQRYTALNAAGWLVARFAWEDVMNRPAYVRQSLVDLVAIASDGRRSA